MPQLQRQIAYDRLLERLYLVDEGWIVKGATALLARELGVREAIDIDVYQPAVRDVAVAELRGAAQQGIGDWGLASEPPRLWIRVPGPADRWTQKGGWLRATPPFGSFAASPTA